MFENGKINYESYDNLIKWQIKQGTQGIVILGSTYASCKHKVNNFFISTIY